MEDDAEHGIDGARRQVLGAGDEVAGGVVDEGVERADGPDLLQHGVDGGGVADVAAVDLDFAPGFRGELGGGLGEDLLAAAADHEFGAELEEAAAHAEAQAGAAAGDEDALALEQVGLEHRATITERCGLATPAGGLPHPAARAYSCVMHRGLCAATCNSAKQPHALKNKIIKSMI